MTYNLYNFSMSKPQLKVSLFRTFQPKKNVLLFFWSLGWIIHRNWFMSGWSVTKQTSQTTQRPTNGFAKAAIVLPHLFLIDAWCKTWSSLRNFCYCLSYQVTLFVRNGKWIIFQLIPIVSKSVVLLDCIFPAWS